MPAKKKSAPPRAAEDYESGAPDAREPEVREEPVNGAAHLPPEKSGNGNGAGNDGDDAAEAYARLPESTRHILETQFRARVLGLREIPAARMK